MLMQNLSISLLIAIYTTHYIQIQIQINNTNQHSLYKHEITGCCTSQQGVDFQLHSFRKGNSCYYLRGFPSYSPINFRPLGQYQTNLTEQFPREVPYYATNWTLKSFSWDIKTILTEKPFFRRCLYCLPLHLKQY